MVGIIAILVFITSTALIIGNIMPIYKLVNNVTNQLSSISLQISETNVSLTKLYNNELSSDIVNKLSSSVVIVIASSIGSNDKLSQSTVFVDTNGQVVGRKGTGFFISCKGIIMTASHVIHNATKIAVVLNPNTQPIIHPGKVIYDNPMQDTAFIQIDYFNVTSVTIGKFVNLGNGKRVGFIGFPLGGSLQSVPVSSQGTISSIIDLARQNNQDSIPTFTIDAFVNPGNSGGPVFLSDTGEVIGMISQKFTDVEGVGIVNAIDKNQFPPEVINSECD